MKALYSLFLVFALVVVSVLGAGAMGWQSLFGTVIPYAAFLLFVIGFCMRVVDWAKSPVPFRIPTTCGQQKSLPWVKHSKLENPSTTSGVVGRMLLEVLCFRSLFRNTKIDLRSGPRLAFSSSKWLWLGALAFHYSFLIIVIRHMRFFTEPVPGLVSVFDAVDGVLQLGAPTFYLTDAIFMLAIVYLLIRRLVVPHMRFISLVADFFPLLLILSIGGTGIAMRYFIKTDVVAIKELTMNLVQLHPVIPEGIGVIFYVHLFLVCTLLVYFPLSKLMHMGGVFMSPTRNMASNNRAVRHINPWNYPVPVHTYAEYEDEFREKMVEAGLPVDKQEGAENV
ncbi:sulfate reduction electron transfer complex DsrMKJOP subunit DsrM [Desulfoplanes sp.]